MSCAATYYTSYSRALLKYANSGFFSRDLDADDFTFIENIRERGCVRCGSLAWIVPTACTYSDDVIHRVALIEEMDFWQQPYQVDKIVVRRSGPVVMRQPGRPAGSTPAAIERKENRQLLEAARAEEKRRLEEKQREQLRRDIEWEKAAPVQRKFGKVKNRHYIPQWKIDELEAEDKRKREERKQLFTSHVQTSRDNIILRRVAISPPLADCRVPSAPLSPQAFIALKRNIMDNIQAVMRITFPLVLTLEQLMVRIGCQDKLLVLACAEELVNEGRLEPRAVA